MILDLLRRRRDDLRERADRGAILVLAIFMVAVVAVVTGAVRPRGDGSLRATVALRDVARSSYAADAAAQVAINDLRTGYNTGNGEPTPWYYTNELGTGCFGYDGSAGATVPKDTLTLDNLIPKQGGETQTAVSAAVVCEPEDATGEQGSAVPINNSNKPGNAIMTLSNGGETGFSFKTNGSGAAFRVKGGIWSSSNIVRDQNGNLESTESIRARTGCSPQSAMVAPVVNCSSAAPADPNYPSDLQVAGSGIPTLRTPPASCPSGGTVQLEPGYYDDATKLNALTDTNSQCFIHMLPGTYYLDFHNNPADPLYDADLAGGSGSVWTVGSRKTLVGGTLTSDPSVPGRCVNPIDDVGAQGVQLIFGGDSRLAIAASGQDTAVELCGSYHANRPPIAIYGQKTGTTSALTDLSGGTALTVQGGTTPVVTPAGTHGTFTGATPGNLQTADGNQSTDADLAVWRRTTTTGGNQARTITVDGFAPGASLPAGTVLKSAVLKVTHRNTSTGNNQVNRVTFTPSGGSPLATAALDARANLTTDTVNLATLGETWKDFKRRVHDSGYTGGAVSFESTLAAATTTNGQNPVVTPQVAQLDAVRLELTYHLPTLRGQTTAAVPGNTVATAGGSAVVQVSGNSTTYYVQGTTYVPLSKIDLSLNNIDESVFRFGVIARSLQVFETGSFDYPGAVIELPDNSPGFGFETTLVRLKVYLCPGVTSGCTKDNGKLSLTSRVKLYDVGADPTKRQVSVLSWSHPR